MRLKRWPATRAERLNVRCIPLPVGTRSRSAEDPAMTWQEILGHYFPDIPFYGAGFFRGMVMAFCLLGLGAYLVRRNKDESLLRFLFPPRHYRTASFRLDVVFYAVNTLFSFFLY